MEAEIELEKSWTQIEIQSGVTKQMEYLRSIFTYKR
jgi:hypothetical protein